MMDLEKLKAHYAIDEQDKGTGQGNGLFMAILA